MKSQIMKRAWEIFRTLTGDRIAKLSAALKQAWAEFKNAACKAVKELKGSVKQIAWAEDIRKSISERNFDEDMWSMMGLYNAPEERKAPYTEIHKWQTAIYKAAAQKMIDTVDNASYYIDMRNDIMYHIMAYAFDTFTSETTEGTSELFTEKFNRSIEKGYSKKIVSVAGTKYIFSVNNCKISIDSKDALGRSGKRLASPTDEEKATVLKAIAASVR